mgnify:CR=1 FL=1
MRITLTRNESIHRWAFNMYAPWRERISWHMGWVWLYIEWWEPWSIHITQEGRNRSLRGVK